ncbi:MAG TPA: hypothetical protein VGU24_07920 [Microvirga sp.]|nr:hypothetical protein [Microvirga sp.]
MQKKAGQRKVQLSLATTDRETAEIKAAPLITAHRQLLFAHRIAIRHAREVKASTMSEEQFEESFLRMLRKAGARIVRQSEPGIIRNPDGTQTFATEDLVFSLSADGKPNGSPVPNERIFKIPLSVLPHGEAKAFSETEKRVNRALKKNSDEQILEAWIAQRNINPRMADEARKVLGTFRTVSGGKSFANATRDDGRELANHYFKQGLKSGTVIKKVGFLNWAVNIAIEDGKLKHNPFSKVVADKKDAEKPLPLDDEDMALIRKHIDRLNGQDALWLRLLALTGMRLSEPLGIDAEFNESGIRYVIIGRVGRKTEQSCRRVPLPDILLPLRPVRITGPLLAYNQANPAQAASKRLNRFLDDVGITSPCKVVHSLRHRAKDRLRAASCPEDIQEEILGHEEETVSRGYGKGYPMTVLKPWVEKIGW